MAMITGRVQINESIKPRHIIVGEPFARKTQNGWETFRGIPLFSIKIKTSEIIKRLINQNNQKNHND